MTVDQMIAELRSGRALLQRERNEMASLIEAYARDPYPQMVAIGEHATYWKLGPDRFNAFPHGSTRTDVRGHDNGAGYGSLRSIMMLKGEIIA